MQSAQFQLHADIEERHWWFVARRRIVTALVHEVLPPCQATTIVDVGCGTGANLGALANDYRCVGIDTSAEAIRLAQARFPHVRFMHGFAPGDLGETLTEARLVLMNDVLEHVPDDFSLLSAMLAASTPGTYFLLTVPADLTLWSEHDESFGHYRRYDLRRFRQLWQGLPVTTLLASAYNARLYPLIKAVRVCNRLRGKSGGVAGTDFKLPSPPVNHLLSRLFAGETRRLLAQVHGRGPGYSKGVSLIALLRREAGPITLRSKPNDAAPDYFDPVERRLLEAAV